MLAIVATSMAPGTAVAQPPDGYLVRPVFQDCPPDTMTYPNRRHPAAEAVHACQFVVNDNGNRGRPIGVRLGRPGPLGSGAFGLLHFTTDHNLSDDAVATVIANNAAPLVRADGRWLYGLTRGSDTTTS